MYKPPPAGSLWETFSLIPLAVVVFRTDGTILHYNQDAKNLLEVTETLTDINFYQLPARRLKKVELRIFSRKPTSPGPEARSSLPFRTLIGRKNFWQYPGGPWVMIAT